MTSVSAFPAVCVRICGFLAAASALFLAASNDQTTSLIVSLGFAGLASAVGAWIARSDGGVDLQEGSDRKRLASRTRVRAWRAAYLADIFASVFIWGAAALAFGYGLTELYWQHWWQYAIAMAVLAAVTLLIQIQTANLVRDKANQAQADQLLDRLTTLTALQGGAAAVGLVFLVVSGKLAADKPDWLANHVFLAGGLAVAILSAFAVWAQRR
ncbi:MAG: hypothetical protein AAFR70_02465 [Pseudomonadota bacterium]